MVKKKGAKDVSHKVGTYITPYTVRDTQVFYEYRGYLKVRQVSTSILLGTVTEDSLKEFIVTLSPWVLSSLKKFLKDFDSREFALDWKEGVKRDSEVKIE